MLSVTDLNIVLIKSLGLLNLSKVINLKNNFYLLAIE